VLLWAAALRSAYGKGIGVTAAGRLRRDQGLASSHPRLRGRMSSANRRANRHEQLGA
jgi:hypothetical protein